jgi:hypothetical protein
MRQRLREQADPPQHLQPGRLQQETGTDRTWLRCALEHLHPMAVARQQQRQRLARRAVTDDTDLHPLLHRSH